MVITLQLHLIVSLDALRTLVFVESFARKNLDIDYDTFHSRRHGQRCILHIASLLTKDRTEQFFFRGQLGFPFRRHLSYQNIARLYFGTDPDNPTLIQISQRLFADIRNISRDIFLPQLGIPGFHLELFDMDRREGVLADQFFTEQYGVLEVVPTPGHERHKDILPQREFAMINGWSISKHLPLLNRLTKPNHWRLSNTGVLVRSLKFDQVIDVQSGILPLLPVLRIGPHYDAGSIDALHDPGPTSLNNIPRISRDHRLHPGPHQRSLRCDQRNRLALHIGTHQCTIGVVMLQKWHERGRHTHHLLWRHVHVLNLIRVGQNKVSTVTTRDGF